MTKLTKTVFPFIIILLTAIFTTGNLYAYPDGITGRTLKTTTAGCSCHGSSADPTVIVSLTGPDSVNTGQTVTFTLLISKSAKTGAGLDASVRRGTLAPVSNTLQLMNGEITHISNIAMTGGSVSVQFSYTAPGTAGFDTIWITGLATNSNNSSSGDNWNWCQSKRIVIRSTVGIKPLNGSIPEKFSLGQNYPNPFNPSTKIKFAVPISGEVRLSLIDISGKEVQVMVNNDLSAGSYEYELNASGLASGIYFYRLTSGDYTDSRKMILVK